MRINGRLEHSDLEGGAWLLVADDGRRFLLVPPPKGEDSGVRVEVEGEIDADAISFQMAGPLLRVQSLRRVGR
jgi:hypothetical protein